MLRARRCVVSGSGSLGVGRVANDPKTEKITVAKLYRMPRASQSCRARKAKCRSSCRTGALKSYYHRHYSN
jgi:hypothetical protein